MAVWIFVIFCAAFANAHWIYRIGWKNCCMGFGKWARPVGMISSSVNCHVFMAKHQNLIVACSILPCKLIWVWGIEVISNQYNQRLESVGYFSPQNMFFKILAVLLFSMQPIIFTQRNISFVVRGLKERNIFICSIFKELKFNHRKTFISHNPYVKWKFVR